MAVSAILGVYADAGNALISFTSAGPDRYADGTIVLDKEWYALVWSQDGNFEGMKLDCTPADENDEVTLVAPLAKNGGCPLTVFQVDSSKVRTNGCYAVYLLDTRNVARTQPSGKNAKGLPNFVNAEVIGGRCAIGSAAGGSTAVAQAGAWEESEIDATVDGFERVKIVGFELEDSQVKITVEGMMQGVAYNVGMGKTPDSLNKYALSVPKTAGDETTFTIERGEARFFRVVRDPIVKEGD